MDRRINIGYLPLILGLAGMGLTLFGPPIGNFSGAPLWVDLHVPGRMARLSHGMTKPQVMTTLGLTGYEVDGPFVGGGPPMQDWGQYTPGGWITLGLAFDTTRTPETFVAGQVNTLDWESAVVAFWVWGLNAGYGAWRCLRPRRKTGGPENGSAA